MKTITLLLTALINSEVFTSCKKAGQLALTYDDGPSPYTGELLNILEEEDVKAAFHFVSDYLDVPYVTAYVRQAADSGHLIGLNSKVNLDKVKLGNDTYFDELIELQDQLQEVIGFKPTYLRVPYSTKYPKDVVNKLEDMGFIVTSHNLDSQDYLYNKKPNDKTGIVWNVKGQLDAISPPAKGSFILVQHDSVAASVNQAKDIIGVIKDKNYDIVRLDDAIGKKDLKKDVKASKGKAPKQMKSESTKLSSGLGLALIVSLFYM